MIFARGLAVCLVAIWAGVAVAQDNAGALFLEANRYHTGDAVPQNHRRAAGLYLRAAKLGHAGAQNQYGKYLFSGMGGIGEDRDEALVWLRKAASTEHSEFTYDLARALEGSGAIVEAAESYGRAAEAGHLDALASLGVLYQHGTGVAQDFDKARQYYEAAALRMHPRALNNLGLLYVRGDGVVQDYTKAAELFAKAADLGLQEAMNNLGVLYDNGFGVEQSDEVAAMWYRRGARGVDARRSGPILDPRLAPLPDDEELRPQVMKTYRAQARAGDPVAQFLIALLLLEQELPAEAARWFEKAASKGHAPSMANLARLYFLGQGVLQDYVSGQMWATLAMSGGMPQAEGIADDLGVQLTPSVIAQAQDAATARWVLPTKDDVK
ncbi:tetratricopeptide repeat protein [Shimia haliotis]|uniref:TPR repeat n=1 Tax=Shimia haliotis TaxID=1280847 RepID=A0A1I4EHL9_9RHOB|nr:SEL1-like repeat protein [Shimia haliotis]SFL05264.1 hypothetical protein SAMN04488036_104299 [Shimia haliotis]